MTPEQARSELARRELARRELSRRESGGATHTQEPAYKPSPIFSADPQYQQSQDVINPTDIVTGMTPWKAIGGLMKERVTKPAVLDLAKKLPNTTVPKERLPIPTSVADMGFRTGTQISPRRGLEVGADIIADPRTYLPTGLPKGSQKAMGAIAGQVEKRVLTPIEAAMRLNPKKLLSKAEKITTEILQSSKGELASYIERGKKMPAITEAAKTITKSKNYGEFRRGIEKEISIIMKERNALIKEPRLVGDYTEGLQKYIDELKQMGQATPQEIRQFEEVLTREKNWVKSNPIYRDTLQTRKEKLQKLTDSLLQKTERGDVIDTQPARNRALNELRRGLKEAIEAGDTKVAELNARYGGLLRAKELIAGQEALAQKAVPQNVLERLLRIITNPKDIAAETARGVLSQQGSLSKTTGKIEKLVRKANVK